MKKILSFVLALLLIGGGVSFADVQIDKGQTLSTASKIWFVGRYARTGPLGNAGNAGAWEISADSVVIWDSNSNDGVSIRTTTTSYDALVAGVTIDRIPGSSRDYSAVSDENYTNWGRIQTWGRHASVRFQVCAAPYNCIAGMKVGTGATSQDSAIFRAPSDDAVGTTTFSSSSKDSYGVLLKNVASTDTTADIFIKNM